MLILPTVSQVFCIDIRLLLSFTVIYPQHRLMRGAVSDRGDRITNKIRKTVSSIDYRVLTGNQYL